jgi:ankyrin repeat protein
MHSDRFAQTAFGHSPTSMIKPTDIDDDAWAVITAAADGDVAGMRRLLDRDPTLSGKGYFYTPPIHFAVREGHSEIVQMLLDAGADSEWNGHYGDSLIDMAKERGHDDVASILEKTRDRRGRTPAAETREDHAIHLAAEKGDVGRVRELLDADPTLLNRGDRAGGTPLHRAVLGRATAVIKFLLDRGANIHAIHGAGLGSSGGYGPHDLQAIDFAIWGGPRHVRPPLWRIVVGCLKYWIWSRGKRYRPAPCDVPTARLLLARGATYDLTIATALGDFDRVKAILREDPSRIREARPNGRRPLTTAVEFGRDDIARFLLEEGANPTWEELNANRGGALHAASWAGNRALVELLLAHGADPNGHSDSAGNSVYVAKTPEIRALLEARGGTLDPFDLVWKDEDDEVIRRVTEDPKSAELGCGGVFTAVVTRGKRDLLKRLLDAGIRVPPVVTGCQSYLLEHPDMLRALLDHGMNPDTCNWQRQTMLHMLCRGDGSGKPDPRSIECAAMLLDDGANISARDDDLRSTPLAWAARGNRPDMIEFLLARGATTNLPDDKSWATPLAWATRRGRRQVAEMLRAAGAKS